MRKLIINEKRFGRLVAKRPIRKNGKRYWLCQCDCGRRIWAPTYQLTAGHKSSCGCIGKEKGDFVGRKFAKLTVVSLAGIDRKSRRRMWLCSCECGGETKAYSRNLQRASVVDCGCGRKDRMRLMGIQRRKPDVIFNRIFDSYQRNAKSRGIKFNLSKIQIAEIISKNCHYCDDAPEKKTMRGHPERFAFFNGIDRMDNNLGYTKSNVVPCCKACNYLKRIQAYDDFIGHAIKIAINFFSKCGDTTMPIPKGITNTTKGPR